MKLIKYFIYIVTMVGCLIFLVELNSLNVIDGKPIHIKIPYLNDIDEYALGFNVWIVLVMTLSAGVLIGFTMAILQIIASKTELLSLRSRLKKIQIELDTLRNQSIEDEIEIIDDFEKIGT